MGWVYNALWLRRAYEIEMPPFRAQGFEPGLAHDPAQQFAVAPGFRREFAQLYHFRLVVDMGQFA